MAGGGCCVILPFDKHSASATSSLFRNILCHPNLGSQFPLPIQASHHVSRLSPSLHPAVQSTGSSCPTLQGILTPPLPKHEAFGLLWRSQAAQVPTPPVLWQAGTRRAQHLSPRSAAADGPSFYSETKSKPVPVTKQPTVTAKFKEEVFCGRD